MTVVNEITEFVKSDLLQGANNDIGPDDALIEDGILTSLQTVELVMFIEDKYGIEIEPELVNEDATGDGWFFKIQIDDQSELDSLMDAKEYKEFVKGLE